MTERQTHIGTVKCFVALAAALLAVALGVIVVAVATPALAQTPDPQDPLALYDRNENGQIDADEFILAFWDYLEGRIDATLLMRVRQLYLSTIATGASQEITWHAVCKTHDTIPPPNGDDVISRAEVIAVITDYLFNESSDLTRDDVLKVIACYYHTYAHLVSFAESTYSVNEGSNVTITLEMSRPHGSSTIDVPVEVVGGSAGSGDFSFTAEGANINSTTTTFATSSTRTSFTVYTERDDDADDESVVLSLGDFSISTTPNDVYPDPRAPTTTVTIVDDDEPTTPSVSITSPKSGLEIGENSSGVSVIVELSEAAGQNVTIPILFSGDRTAYNVAGMMNNRLNLSFSGTQTRRSFTFDPVEDNSDCTNEAITISIDIDTLPSTVTLGTPNSIVIKIDDNEDCPEAQPGKPGMLGYTPSTTNGSVDLRWGRASNAGSYRVLQCKKRAGLPQAPCRFTEVKNPGNATSTTIGSLDTDSLHQFRVRAVSPKGTKRTDSDTLEVNLKPAPENLTATYTLGQYGQLTLTWDAVLNPDATYTIDQKGPGLIRLWRVITPTVSQQGSQLQALVSDLKLGETYDYRVRANSVHGESEWSEEASGFVQDERPPRPRNLEAEYLVGYRGIKLSWDNDSTGKTSSYEVETEPTDSFINISLVSSGGSQSTVTITGLNTIRYKIKVYGRNAAGRSKDPDIIFKNGPQPTYTKGHQADHTVKYDKSGVTNSVIRTSLDRSARAWNAVTNFGLRVCDDSTVSCNGKNTDEGIVSVKVFPTSPSNTHAGCKGWPRLCVSHGTFSGPPEPIAGKPRHNMDLKVEDPAYTCPNGRKSCHPANSTLYRWTAVRGMHWAPIYDASGNSVIGNYVFLQPITTHEFGHTFGLPDFYTPKNAVNWDSRLLKAHAIMRITFDGLNPMTIQVDEDIAQLDAIYSRHTPHTP